MWTLIGRVAMNIFLPLHTNFFFMRVFVKYTDPIISIFGPVTPRFLVEPLIPLYVAWFFYLFRFYFMPWALGYSVMGMLSFPLEGEVTQMLMLIFSKQLTRISTLTFKLTNRCSALPSAMAIRSRLLPIRAVVTIGDLAFDLSFLVILQNIKGPLIYIGLILLRWESFQCGLD